MQKNVIENIYEIISKGVKSGIGQLYTEDKFYDRTTITFGSKKHVNFGSYSYLGLELDQRLKEGAKTLIEKYGIQFPSSRTYVSSTPYLELESLLEDIFNAPIVLATTTTLAHVATMPIVVNEGDIIIMDQQVHSSVQFMVSHLKNYGVNFQIVRHNNLEHLEKKIIELSEKHSKVWYMLDGIYSMYGDVAPMKDLEQLLIKYPKFHLYVDDAHGMSWCGKNGAGYVLSEINLHERMILVTSLNKAFAAGGALVVMKDEELSKMVKTCGGPFIFAGQHQMSALGAGIECAKIHLSSEITTLQEDLASKIAHCQAELESYGLPIVSSPESPIFFIGVGLPRVGYNLVKKMIDSGQYVNLAIFPAVAETRTGVRFTITVAHSIEQISEMARLLSQNFQLALLEEERTIDDIYHAFRREKIFKVKNTTDIKPNESVSNFELQCETSITQIPKPLWNKLLGNSSSLDWDGLLSLEKSFSKAKLAQNKWEIFYYIVKDENQKPILATYFTHCLTKDDAISPPQISFQIEKERRNNSTYLCSKTFMMGCPISVGNHLYLNKSNADWKKAFMYFLEFIWNQQDKLGANTLNLRDFTPNDIELKQFLLDQGFIKVSMLENYEIPQFKPFKDPLDYINGLSSSQRYFVKKRAASKSHLFKRTIISGDSSLDEIDAIYKLYKNIKDKSFELNMFDYPRQLFIDAVKSNSWDVMTISIKNTNEVNRPIALAISSLTSSKYNFLIAGLDYNSIENYDTYSQLLWQIVLRANELGFDKIGLGLTTGQNKRKFGAKEQEQEIFIQLKDNYNASVVASMSNNQVINLNKLALHKRSSNSY